MPRLFKRVFKVKSKKATVSSLQPAQSDNVADNSSTDTEEFLHEEVEYATFFLMIVVRQSAYLV